MHLIRKSQGDLGQKVVHNKSSLRNKLFPSIFTVMTSMYCTIINCPLQARTFSERPKKATYSCRLFFLPSQVPIFPYSHKKKTVFCFCDAKLLIQNFQWCKSVLYSLSSLHKSGVSFMQFSVLATAHANQKLSRIGLQE
jgi:hypothetical protein